MSMELVHNRCLFTDKQMIRLQVGRWWRRRRQQFVERAIPYPSAEHVFSLMPWEPPSPRARESPGRRALVGFVRF